MIIKLLPSPVRLLNPVPLPNFRSNRASNNACRLDSAPACSTTQTPQSLNKTNGYSLIELTIAISVATILILGINGLLNTALQAERQSRSQNDTLQQARFAMQQMVKAVASTQRLMIPLSENPSTAWSESVRDVLAVTLDPTLDRDKDGWADANNDEDFLDINNNTLKENSEPELIDEDPGGDLNNDAAPGIFGIDDDGDGNIDEQHTGSGPLNEDDDEDGTANEDAWNEIDDDSDNTFDEDPKQDMSADALPGIGLVDDDGDGTVDEGDKNDDDEDGDVNEDWFDPVVFFLNGTTLMQRIPNINPVDGKDYGEYVIAENVSQFQVIRSIGGDGQTVLIDITLMLSPPDTEPVSLKTQIRVGARQ